MAVVPRIGTEFAGYRIEALLGRGGMSVVYRAENVRLGNKVALKLLADELADDESFRERFVRESRTAATLNHPNIVTIYDAGDFDGVLYIAMRWVDGDLKELLAREGPLSAAKTMAVIGQIASALDAAHARGLLHRDVKPANILLDLASEPGGVPHAYLADFGLTKHLESRSGITASGQFVGTIDYMSPEQIEGREVDGRSDIYSLGCVLFECLAGTTPYRRETDVAVLWAHMREAPPPVTELRPELPGAVDLVIARAVDKDPAERYGTAREFLEDLRRSLEGAPDARTLIQTQRDSELPTTVRARPDAEAATRQQWRRLSAVAAGLGVLLVGAAAAAAGYVLGDRGEPQSTPTRSAAVQPPPAPPAPTDDAPSFHQGVLLQKIPMAIRRTCEPTEPPSLDFLASVVCRPAGGIIKVEYSEAESGARNNRYFDKRIRAERTADPAGLSPAVNCHTPPPIRQWDSVGIGGHRPEPHTIGGRGYQGRFICYQSNWWAAIEWTDARVDVYAIAYGRNIARLFRWWKAKPGPIRSG